MLAPRAAEVQSLHTIEGIIDYIDKFLLVLSLSYQSEQHTF